MGRDPVQGGTLRSRLFHDCHIPRDQIAQTAVNHLRAATGGAAGEILRFNQCHRQSPHGGVSRHAGPGYPAANHQQIEALTCECPQRCGAVGLVKILWCHASPQINLQFNSLITD